MTGAVTELGLPRSAVNEGWIPLGRTILRTDGTVHQFPFIPGRNPLHWHSLESSRALRRLLSPFAYTYFVAAAKSARPSPGRLME